jgi:hypothetical protein
VTTSDGTAVIMTHDVERVSADIDAVASPTSDELALPFFDCLLTRHGVKGRGSSAIRHVVQAHARSILMQFQHVEWKRRFHRTLVDLGLIDLMPNVPHAR